MNKIWNKIIGFKEGDRVRIIRVSEPYHKEEEKYYLGETGVIFKVLYKGKLLVVRLDKKKGEEVNKIFIATPEDLEYA